MRTKLRKTAITIFWVAVTVNALNFGAGAVWEGRNPCLRAHTEYPTHADPYEDSAPVDVCDWYKTDPSRNPWLLNNEFRTVKDLLAQ